MQETKVPGIEILDPEMAQIADAAAVFDEIADGMGFTEGPAWMPDKAQLVFSDIPGNTMYAWSQDDGLQVFRRPSNNTNGNTVDNQGRLVSCEHGSRRVTRTAADGTVEVLAQTHAGGKLNSPNDAAVKSDGTIWFTDPTYGLGKRPREQDGNYVYRLDPGAAEPVPVATDFAMPNGICFSPDEALLYVSDTARDHHHIRRFKVTADNALEDDGILAVIRPGVPDGFRVDTQGRIFTTAGDGVHVLRPDGSIIGKFRTPRTAANCCFGGPDGTHLFITASDRVWRVPLLGAGTR